MKLKISIIYDNIAVLPDLIADWGWSCLIETNKRKILFDTGGNGRILLNNMDQLKIDPAAIDDIVISHPDFDHIGGLSHLLNSNNRAVVHVPASFRGIKYPNQVKYYAKPTEIYEGIFLTGELAEKEQSLAIKTETGLSLIIGCAHSGVGNIIQSISKFGKVKAIVGGFHGFDDFTSLTDIDLICPTHCTRYKDKIKALFPDNYTEGGAGKVIFL
jgi:7,8-dihydropterin-6-yl-methyl-4-(beta-D-ribofuranosyl)aminobenzene 5'-phosphate synthase